MVIKRDLSDLPTAHQVEDTITEGVSVYPTKEPQVGQHLAQAWFNARTHDDNLPRALPEAGPFRGSDAAKCTRRMVKKSFPLG